jgi:NAD(P)-dependent dehydrogenase (short-subunit alcohol dehydrogenase family)
MQQHATKNAIGWDKTYVTNHLGPFAFTEPLVPHLPDGANVVFVASAVEDPERKPAKAVGFRGGRYISAEASAHGEWKPGGSKLPGVAGSRRLRYLETSYLGYDAGVRSRDAAPALQCRWTGVNPATSRVCTPQSSRPRLRLDGNFGMNK